jgi:hypothetical protein
MFSSYNSIYPLINADSEEIKYIQFITFYVVVLLYHMNQLNNNLNKITHKISEEGAPVLEQLIEKLTGKGAIITYSFNNLKIEIPTAKGPEGRQIGGGNLTVNGTLRISAEVHKKNNVRFEGKKGYEMPSKVDIRGYESNNDVIH